MAMLHKQPKTLFWFNSSGPSDVKVYTRGLCRLKRHSIIIENTSAVYHVALLRDRND